MSASRSIGFSVLAASDDEEEEDRAQVNETESESDEEELETDSETDEVEITKVETQPILESRNYKRSVSELRSAPDNKVEENETVNFRNDHGISVQHADETAADFYEPVLSFEALASRGVSADLVEVCRRCAAGGDEDLASSIRPTAVQAECWGLLLRAVTQCSTSPHSEILQIGLRPEDIPVPDDDTDLDSDEDDAKTTKCNSLAVESSDASRTPCISREDATRCEVRESNDVIGIAPTGSGKTLAYLLPLLADGLCVVPLALRSLGDAFSRFVEIFPSSFPLNSKGNVALLEHAKKLHAAGKSADLLTCMKQVGTRGAADKNPDNAKLWELFVGECDSVNLLAPQSLVLAPTREIAFQVALVGRTLGAACRAVVGGVDPVRQRETITSEAPALIVATPGRLRALCGQLPSSTRRRVEAEGGELPTPPDACMLLSGIVRLVLDEGDRLLDEGFEEDIQALENLASNRRHSMVFSATWSPVTESLSVVFHSPPIHIAVAGIPTAISQKIELVPKSHRGRRLRALLGEFGQAKVLVFVLFKQEAKALAKMLVTEGHNAFAMQGNMSQSARAKTLQSFRDSPYAVLVATDLAARGLDVRGVTHVVNFSLGLSIDSYIHRIGRCGRAGRKGVAVTFVTDGDERHVSALLKLLEQARQDVPSGLREMAITYEHNRNNADFAKLTVKSTGQRGETRAVAKFGSPSGGQDEPSQTAAPRSVPKAGFKIWKGSRGKTKSSAATGVSV